MPQSRPALAAALLLLAACAGSLHVDVVVAPDAPLAAARTFRLLPPPRRPAPRLDDGSDPMLVNTITGRALRTEVRANFVRLGYVEQDADADLLVAVYASAREKLDVTTIDYGYPWHPRWWRGWPRGRETITTEYVEGTVLIDVLDGRTRELVWRGRAVSRVPDEQEAYVRDLERTVRAVLDRFPPRRRD